MEHSEIKLVPLEEIEWKLTEEGAMAIEITG